MYCSWSVLYTSCRLTSGQVIGEASSLEFWNRSEYCKQPRNGISFRESVWQILMTVLLSWLSYKNNAWLIRIAYSALIGDQAWDRLHIASQIWPLQRGDLSKKFKLSSFLEARNTMQASSLSQSQSWKLGGPFGWGTQIQFPSHLAQLRESLTIKVAIEMGVM